MCMKDVTFEEKNRGWGLTPVRLHGSVFMSLMFGLHVRFLLLQIFHHLEMSMIFLRI